MAGYSDKRVQNHEIKYLRRMLGQVDDHIKLPENLSASALRPLLDSVEPPSQSDAVRRRPGWLSLQSGIAYAAAFVLIVALFYSMERYTPEIITGGMRVAEPEQSSQTTSSENDSRGTVPSSGSESAASDQPGAEPAGMPDIDVASDDSDPVPETFSVENHVGGVKSNLLLEQDKNAYYGRKNDISDPDRPGFATLEVIDRDSGELVSQIDMPDMQAIDICFIFDDNLLVVGQDEDSVVIRSVADSENPDDSSSQFVAEQPGTLIDARIYKDVMHIVSISDSPAVNGETATLPFTDIDDACVIFTAVNLETFEITQKSFIGANGTVQLHNLNAYIHYEGVDEDGEPAGDFIGQVLLDGMDIELGPVS